MESKSVRMDFAVCVLSEGFDDLETCKIYRVLPDLDGVKVGCLRVIDESGEDYLYPADRFVILNLPEKERQRLLTAIKLEAG